jgi:transposase-like protein
MIFGTIFLTIIIFIFYYALSSKGNRKCPYCDKPMVNNKGRNPFDPFYNRYKCYDCGHTENS